MAWGRRLPRQGDWLVGLGLLTLVTLSGIGWSVLAEHGFAPESWLRGWIGPREETGAITVGVLRDPLGLTLAIVAAVVAAVTLFGAGEDARAERAGRFYASLGILSVGAALCVVRAHAVVRAHGHGGRFSGWLSRPGGSLGSAGRVQDRLALWREALLGPDSLGAGAVRSGGRPRRARTWSTRTGRRPGARVAARISWVRSSCSRARWRSCSPSPCWAG